MTKKTSEFIELSELQQKTLLEEQERLKFILYHTPVLIGYWNNQLINEYCNPAYSQWFALSPEEIKGKHIHHLLSDDLYHDLFPKIEGVLNGKEQHYKRLATDTKTGEQIHKLTRYLPHVVDDRVIGFYSLGIDSTDHDQLVDHKVQNDSILESLVIGVMLTDTNNKITYLNPAFEKITNYSQNELIGKNFDILKGSNTDIEELNNLTTAINARQPYQCKLFIYRKEGIGVWNKINLNPIVTTAPPL